MPGFEDPTPTYPNNRREDPTPTPSHPPSSTPVTVETVTEDTDATVSPTVPSGETDPSEASKPHITNIQDYYDVPVRLPRFSPDDLIGLTFLHDVEDGQKVRAKIVKKILDKDAENHKNIKMLVSYDDDRIEELITYNELCDIVAEQHDREESGDMETFTFREVLDHAGPLKPSDSNYNGSSYNVKILWEDGSQTWEPLKVMIGCDPVTLATYARDHSLLSKPGWKKLKPYVKNAKKLQRMVNGNKRAQRYGAITYKFGVRVPRHVKEAYRLDFENGNTLWADAMKLEIAQLHE